MRSGAIPLFDPVEATPIAPEDGRLSGHAVHFRGRGERLDREERRDFYHHWESNPERGKTDRQRPLQQMASAPQDRIRILFTQEGSENTKNVTQRRGGGQRARTSGTVSPFPAFSPRLPASA
jgi:hypothetical protein